MVMTDIRREYAKIPLVGVGALIVNDNKVALVRRANEPSKGQWSIPGGLVNLGESLPNAVTREAFEETGLIVRPKFLVELLDRIFHDESGAVRYHYVLADYWCEVTGGNLSAGSDASAAVWVNLSELSDFNLADVTMDVILKGFEMYRGHLGSPQK
jgi:ADP-ribose pyrophosphatase YjhB (NUDIX family)